MIKHGRADEEKFLFIAICNSPEPQLLKIPFSEYDELLEFDFPALLKDEEFFKNYLTDEPLIAVCTNGKRDKCCAKFGLQLFKNFKNYFEEAVWQTSHIGAQPGGSRPQPCYAQNQMVGDDCRKCPWP